MSYHDLRHEAISRLAESGQFQLIELQAISGHRDTRMLLRYAHLCCGNLAAKMDGVAVERTTKEYVHHGRRRRVDTVTSVLGVQPRPTLGMPQPPEHSSGKVIPLFGAASARSRA